MKGGKDAEKVMGPLFPRLHVKDTEKGGPRAPPRNKMALYEQLSVPSRRFSSASSTLPFLPHNMSTLVPSTSSSQGGGHERSVFSPFSISPSSPVHSSEKFHSHYSYGMNFNGVGEFERKSMKNGSYKTSEVMGHLLLNVESNSTHRHGLSCSRNSSGKKSAEDECTVLAYERIDGGRLDHFPMHLGQSTVSLARIPQQNIRDNCNSSVQLRNRSDKSLKRTKTTDLKSRPWERNSSVQNLIKTMEIKRSSERATPHPSVVEKITEASSNHAGVASVGNCPNACTTECDNAHIGNSQFCQEASVGLLSENNINADGISVERGCLKGNGIEEKKNASRVRSEPGPKVSPGDNHRIAKDAENCIEESGMAELGNVDRNNVESETSMVDSLSGLNISPDDIVGVIGQKHFWKARRAIVNQQRVFAVQVFELHRLIKVQKLIAGSPELLIEDNPYLIRTSPKVPAKKLTSESSPKLKSQSQIIKQKDDSQKPSQNADCARRKDESQKLPLPSLGDGVDAGLDQNSIHESYSGNAPSAPTAADNNSNPGCFHPPANQWLVPIMSPSEGLVYKPCMGPYPPNVGVMTPVHGGCGPLSLPSAAAYGAPASHKQPGARDFSGARMASQNCFSPAYGVPFVNPMISTPDVEWMNPSAGAQQNHEAIQVSTGDINSNLHSQSSCNTSNRKSEALSFCGWKFHKSKDSEVQGSSASSPCERVQEAGHVVEGREGRDALPLFPVDPAMDSSELTPQVQSVEQQTRVIKVVPHNPKAATVSAERIFLSIQKERQQFDLQ